MNEVTIDLSKYKNDGAMFIVGRENCEKARKDEKLDKLVEDCLNGKLDKIKIVCTKDLYGVISSFILGMFSEVLIGIEDKSKIDTIFDFSSSRKEIQDQFKDEFDFILGR